MNKIDLTIVEETKIDETEQPEFVLTLSELDMVGGGGSIAICG